MSCRYSKYIAARASNRSGNASKFAVIQSRIDAQLFLIKNLVFLCEKISFYKTNFQAVLRTPSIPSFMTPLTPFMTPLTPFLPASLSSVPYSKDARTMLEADLKQVCETFILESSKQVMDPLSSFVVKAQCVKYGKLGDQNFGMPAVVQSVYSVFMESQLSILKSILEKLASYIGDIQTRSLLERKIGDRVQRTYVQFYELLAESKEYDFAMASPDELDKLIANMMGH